MAICKVCGARQAGVMSDLCSSCIENHEPLRRDGLASASQASDPLSEGSMTSAIGTAIIWVSIAGAIACIFTLGRVEIPNVDGLYGSQTVWSSTLVASFVAAGLNGVFFGFLLNKLGSVLRHLEDIRGKK